MSRRSSGRWPAVIAVAVLLAVAAGAAPAHADSPDRQTEISARQAFAAGRYDEAIELFAKLYAETLNPIYLRNIGRCHQKKRQPDKAIDAFRDYLAKGRGITAAERKEIQGYIREMEELRDEEAKRAQAPQPQPPPAQQEQAPPVQPLGTQPSPAGDPGQPLQPVALNAPPPADAPAATAVSPAPPRSKPFYKRWWFWTIVGVAALGTLVVVSEASKGTTRPDCPFNARCQ